MKQMMAILGMVIAGLAGAVHAEDDSNISTAEQARQQDKTDMRTDRRPSCSYGLVTPHSYDLNPDFYIEKKKIVPIGNTIKKDDVLFYGQYATARMFATADELIENIDRSPLTPNWKWEPNERREVLQTFSGDGRTTYYLIASHRYAYWVSDMEGMLCDNVFDIERGKVVFKGMPRIFQTKPLRFETVEEKGAPLTSVSVTAKEVSGATVTLELNVMRSGRVVKKKIETFDAMGGQFEFAGLKFELEPAQGGWKLVSVTEPPILGFWIGLKLDVPQR